MKKSTKIIIAIVSILVIAGAVVATLFLTGVIGGKKKPQEGFYEYLDKTTEGMSDLNWSDAIAKLKQSAGETMQGKGTISMDVELQGALSEYKDIAKILNKVELGFDAKVDSKNSKLAAAVNVKYDGEDLGTIDVVANKDKIGLKIAEIYDKYLTMDVEDLLDEANIDLDEIESAVNSIDTEAIIELLDISDSEISRIVNRYKDVLKSAIPESNYSTKSEKINVNGKDINTTAYTVKISDKDLVKVAKKVLESLKEDDDTIKLVVEKANKVMEIFGESTKLTKSMVSSFIESALESIDDVEELTGKAINITLYEYKDQIVRIVVSMDDDAIIIDSIKEKDTENGAIKVKYDGKEMTLLNIEQTKKGEGKYFTKLSMDLGEIDEQYDGMKFEISADTEMTDSVNKADMKLYVEVAGMAKVTLNIELEANAKSVKIDDLTSSNSTDIESLSESNIMSIAMSAIEYIEDKMDIVQDIATALGYEDEFEELEDQLSQLKTLSTLTSNSTINSDILDSYIDEDEDEDEDEYLLDEAM